MKKQRVNKVYKKSIDNLISDSMHSIEKMEDAFNEDDNENIGVAFNHMQETLRHLMGNPE